MTGSFDPGYLNGISPVLKGGWGSRSHGRPAPATPMATTGTELNPRSARVPVGAGLKPAPTPGLSRYSKRESEAFRPASVSHRQPVEDIRQLLGSGDGVRRFAMQHQAFRPQARQIPVDRFPIHL